MKKDKQNIELVVLKCFIRTIKSDGKYMLYRRGVNNTGIMKYLLKNYRPSSDSPFASATSNLDVANTLEKITNDMVRSNGKKGGVKDLDKYEHVTMTINHLLHFFMEANGVPMQKLCSMGEEIYGLSCNKLFGDTIEEVEKHQEQEINNIKDLGQLKAKMFQDYINGIQSGDISHSISFEQYFESNKEKFDNVFKKLKKHSNDNRGQVLGSVPDTGNGFLGELNHRNWIDDDWDFLPDENRRISPLW